MIWTDEAVEELKKMWDKGMTTGQIAKVLNVTKNSIIGKVHRLCLTARPSPIKKSNKTTEEKKATPAKKAEKTTKAKSCTPAPKKLEQAPIKEEVKPVVPVPEEINIPLVKLDNHTCRWPMGDPRDEDFCFCGKRIKTGQTYCEEHAAIAYVKPGKKI
ncbi:MAG: global cell cycle regulator GcrA-like protein [Alphaproteobacteria bacterium]|nr:global cell cycle regulator GcrA-like protein [Alphaproteobacteria bacterium]